MEAINKNRLQLLVQELRSGKWKPATGSEKIKLRYRDNIRSINGIACEVYMQMIGKGRWENNDFIMGGLTRSNFLHGHVAKFFYGSLVSEDNHVTDIFSKDGVDLQNKFEHGNMTFEQVADILEDSWNL